MRTEEVVVTARKWGNSLGITLPAEVVERERIRPRDRLVVSVRKTAPISQLFGIGKFSKSGQKLKDEIKAGWDG